MQGKGKTYFIIGIIFIVLGVVQIFTNTSRPLAYGNIVVGIVFMALTSREKKKNDTEQQDGSAQTDEGKKEEE